MAFLANKELQSLLPTIIHKYDSGNIKNASYELRLGSEVYSNNNSQKAILTSENPQFSLEPGQFALLITEEEIKIPKNYIGFISLKFGFKKKGLVNISGFHVDPGFHGRLKFSVYNAGAHSIILERNKPYFVLWLSQLTSSLDKGNKYNGTHQGQNTISPEDIMDIKGELASPNILKERIKGLENKFDMVQLDYKNRSFMVKWVSGVIIAILVSIMFAQYRQIENNEKAYNSGLENSKLMEAQRAKYLESYQKMEDSLLNSYQEKISEIDTISS